MPAYGSGDYERFLSTLSLRRATVKATCMQVIFDISIHALLAESDVQIPKQGFGPVDFYPRSPCGERLTEMRLALDDIKFLSTLSLRRATVAAVFAEKYFIYFYPRSPCGERPAPQPSGQYDGLISIHALLAESDGKRGTAKS